MVMRAMPCSRAKRSVLRRALPRTKKGILRSSCSASGAQPAVQRPELRAGAEMRWCRFAVELEVVAEHRQQVFLQAHHQRMDPGVEDHVGALEAHLRRVARREVLDMDGGRDDRAGDAEPLGDVALHLGAEHQIGLKLRDLGFDLQIVVGDQRLDAVVRGGFADLARQFAAVGAEADYREAQFLVSDPRRGDGVAWRRRR